MKNAPEETRMCVSLGVNRLFNLHIIDIICFFIRIVSLTGHIGCVKWAGYVQCTEAVECANEADTPHALKMPV